MVLPADEPDDEQRQEEEENDFQPPFSIPEDEEVTIADDEDDEGARRPALGTTHPITDSSIDENETYDEGPSGAAEANEPNADDAVLGYTKPAPDKPGGNGRMLELTYKGHAFPAYIVSPRGAPRGAVLVIHEVWGLDEHTKDIANRLAREGYLALAPDLLTETDLARHAGRLQLDLFNPETRSEAQPKLRALMAPTQSTDFTPTTLGKLEVCFDHLYDDPEVKERVAVIGFCFGGSYAYSLATQEERLSGVVAFYGQAPADTGELARIRCPVLGFYGENDTHLIRTLPTVTRNMEQAGVAFEPVVYPNSGHAFFNDTNPYAYNKRAAEDAWQRVLQFLSDNLS